MRGRSSPYGNEVAERFPIPVPEHLSGDRALEGAREKPAHRSESGHVEPDDRVGLAPRTTSAGTPEVTLDHDLPVVAIDHPGRLRCGSLHLGSELGFGPRLPPRLVHQPVELDQWRGHPCGEGARERRFTGSTHSYDGYASHPEL
jgi:hypothetical protein